MVNFWAKVKSNTFHKKLLWLLFGQLMEKFGLLFNFPAGHSVTDPLTYQGPKNLYWYELWIDNTGSDKKQICFILFVDFTYIFMAKVRPYQRGISTFCTYE